MKKQFLFGMLCILVLRATTVHAQSLVITPSANNPLGGQYCDDGMTEVLRISTNASASIWMKKMNFSVVGDTAAIESVTGYFEGLNWLLAAPATPVNGKFQFETLWNWYGIINIYFVAQFSPGSAGAHVAIQLDSVYYHENYFGGDFVDSTVITGNQFDLFDCSAIAEPQADFDITDVNLCSGEYTAVADNSTGSIVSWHWDFPNGYPWYWDQQVAPAVQYYSVGQSWAKLTVVDIYNRTSTDSVLITVWPEIWATIDPQYPPAFCEGGSVELSTATPGDSYQWIYNGSEVPGATNSIFSATEPGSYQVLAIDQSGCTGGSNWVNVQVKSNPAYADVVTNPNPIINDTTHVCVGSTVGGYVQYTGNAYTDLDYLWSNGNTDGYINNMTPGEYWVKITDPDSLCPPAIDSFVVVPAPVLSLSVTGSSTACVGDTVTLYANGNVGVTYWGSGEYADSIKVTSDVVGETYHYLYCQGEYNCFSQPAFFSVNFTDKPATPSISWLENCLVGTTAIASNYQYLINGNIISGGATISADTIGAGWYQVAVSNGGCWSEWSDSVYVNCIVVTGIEDPVDANILISPNPFMEQFSVLLPEGMYKIELFNILGQRMLSEEGSGTITVSRGDLPAGMYVLQVTDGAHTFRTKVEAQ